MFSVSVSFEKKSTKIDQGLRTQSAVHCKQQLHDLNWRFLEKKDRAKFFQQASSDQAPNHR